MFANGEGVLVEGSSGAARAPRSRGWALLWLLVMLGQVGCAPPTAVRRTTLIPAPSLPTRVGPPLRAGEGRAALEIDALQLDPLELGELDVAQEGDPGVLVPDFHLGGSFYMAVSELVELGLGVQYTRASWADPNLSGVLPFPVGTDQDLWGVGPGMRLNFELTRDEPTTITLSLVGQLDITSVPEVVFRRVAVSVGDEEPSYALHRDDSRVYLMPNVAANLGFDLGHGLDLGLLLGAQQSVTNVGFDSLQNIEKDTTETFGMIYVGAGLDFRIDPFFTNVHLILPFEGEEEIAFGPRTRLQLGYAF